MANIKPKIKINQEDGVMSIQLKPGRSVESDISGNAVIDYDKKGNIVRINLYKINFDAFRKQRASFQHFAQSAHMNVAIR